MFCMTFEDLAYFYDMFMVLFVIVEFDSTHPHLLFPLYEKGAGRILFYKKIK